MTGQYPIIFLDIDKVLNDGNPLSNGFMGFVPEYVDNLNKILEAVPDARIVLISSWKYQILNGNMNLDGFEVLMQSHGVKCRGKMGGYTEGDPYIYSESIRIDWRKEGMKWRVEQIEDYIER